MAMITMLKKRNRNESIGENISHVGMESEVVAVWCRAIGKGGGTRSSRWRKEMADDEGLSGKRRLTEDELLGRR